jgi:dynein light chain roadblock-type
MEPNSDTLAILSRLSSKPGVQSTLVLSSADGTILRSDGILPRRKRAGSENQRNTGDGTRKAVGEDKTHGDHDGDDRKNGGATDAAAEIARTVWKFVKATEGLVSDMDGSGEDELKLLRVRTRRNEVVVVPSK